MLTVIRGTHELCEVTRQHEPCTRCHVPIGAACADARGTGVHLCRPAAACADKHMTLAELGSLIDDGCAFGNTDLVLDPGGT